MIFDEFTNKNKFFRKRKYIFALMMDACYEYMYNFNPLTVLHNYWRYLHNVNKINLGDDGLLSILNGVSLESNMQNIYN